MLYDTTIRKLKVKVRWGKKKYTRSHKQVQCGLNMLPKVHWNFLVKIHLQLKLKVRSSALVRTRCAARASRCAACTP